MPVHLPRLVKLAVTFGAAFCGGGLFALLGLPAPWLTGGMIAVAVLAICRFDALLPIPLRHVIFVLLGTSIGASVTPELLSRLGEWPLTLLSVIATVALIQVAVQFFLMRFSGWDWPTAFFAAIPGMTSYIMVVALPTTADLRRVAILQSMRAFLLVAVTPSLLDVAVEAVEPAVAEPGSLATLAISLGAGILGGFLFSLCRLPAAWLLGALVGSAVVHGAGIAEGALPQPLLIFAFLGIGALLGSRFFGFDLALLRNTLVASVGAFVIAMGLAGLAALAIASVSGQPFGEVALALAPGGLDVMTALAFALHLDSVFVAAHQLVRFFLIAVVAPIVARAFTPRS